jgi:hypothetical protein
MTAIKIHKPFTECGVEQLQEQLFPIEIKIVERLHEHIGPGYRKDRSKDWDKLKFWTNMILFTLHNLGVENNYLVFPKLKKDYGNFINWFTGEWMLDLVWVDAGIKNDNCDWKKTRGLKLGCECEWSATEDNILEDFFKLTFSNAELKIFIYYYTKIKVNSKKIYPNELCKSVCPLSKGNRYLLIGFESNNKPKDGMHIDVWTA